MTRDQSPSPPILFQHSCSRGLHRRAARSRWAPHRDSVSLRFLWTACPAVSVGARGRSPRTARHPWTMRNSCERSVRATLAPPRRPPRRARLLQWTSYLRRRRCSPMTRCRWWPTSARHKQQSLLTCSPVRRSTTVRHEGCGPCRRSRLLQLALTRPTRLPRRRGPRPRPLLVRPRRRRRARPGRSHRRARLRSLCLRPARRPRRPPA